MNRAQKLLLTLALVIVIAMGLYPPWIRTDAQGIRRPRGYSLIVSPPTAPADAIVVNGPVRYSVDWNRLAKAWLYVAGLSLPLIVLLRTHRRRERA
jgi:hypothetical protein